MNPSLIMAQHQASLARRTPATFDPETPKDPLPSGTDLYDQPRVLGDFHRQSPRGRQGRWTILWPKGS